MQRSWLIVAAWIYTYWACLFSICYALEGYRKEHVCKDQHIINDVKNLHKLQNCTVIEGYLKVYLIDHSKWEDFENLTFPNLVEVTDYLLFYRVKGLRTLRTLFPNLAVIKGQNLFYNYALVVFEMLDMVEIGLRSLTTIQRGAVRFEKNPSLCYIDTIDWTVIAQNVDEEDHFIKDNKDSEECVNKCPENCPVLKVNGYDQSLCWTSNVSDCQKVPQPGKCSGGGLMSINKQYCCHRECVGSCKGPKATDCVACKHIFHEGRCQEKCDVGTYEYKHRRCLFDFECRRLDNDQRIPKALRHNWVLHDEKCLEECPPGFTPRRDDPNICEPCKGPCPKKCPPLIVDSIAAAQKLKGCTIIEGILDIQIAGGTYVGKELEENLGQIEEIDHYLKITRSYALLSLSFLKKLRKINGHQLANGRHSLVVLDNQNLQDIWDYNNHPKVNLSVNQKASVFFHDNHKLCLHKIQELVRIVGVQNNTDEKDVSPYTNGDQIACNVTEMQVGVESGPSYAVVKWTNFRTQDQRELLNFVVNYREAPHRNITKFNARDACGTDVWKTEDQRANNDKEAEYVFHILHNLQPFTQYAIYVNTYTIARAKRGAVSNIVYFRTDPDIPTTPRGLKAAATREDEMVVEWKMPNKPNGIVTHYQVYWQEVKLDPDMFDQRDYCKDKLKLSSKPKVITGPESETKKNVTGRCPCPKSKKLLKQEERERNFQIEFENYLQNSVYTKRDDSEMDKNERRRRDTGFKEQVDKELLLSSTTADPNSVIATEGNMTTASSEKEDSPFQNVNYRAAIVHNATFLVLPNLDHFQEYNIEVIACHDYDQKKETKRCSNRAIITHRTLHKSNADDVDPTTIRVSNKSLNEVELRWSDPKAPNGLIITYEIEYKLENVKHIHPTKICISHKQFRGTAKRSKRSVITGTYELDKLNPGKYSFKLRATSLAGNGSWTPDLYFYVADPDIHGPNQVGLIAGIAASAAFMLIMAVAGGVWYIAKRRFNQNVPGAIQYASVNPEYMSAADVYIPDEWEVPRDKIALLRELGQGSFGMVYEGLAKDIVEEKPECKVAVKTVNENASLRDRIEFLNEASVMKAFSCNHVVKLLGVVSKGQPTLVVMELMANGDLKKFLRLHRPDEEENSGRQPPTLKQIFQMAAEICDGMSYLADKKFVHRDLAARNCMVAEDLTVKIGDFGMTRDIYETDYYRKGGKGLLPVRWMAPESLKDGIFTSMSDVWSFGVVLWEMATLAAQPYQGLANEQVLKYVIDGGIMEKPEGCPDRLYDMMRMCWKHNPRHRLSFQQFIEELLPDLDPKFKDVSYYFSEENMGNSDNEDIEEGEDLNNSNTPLTHTAEHTDSESSIQAVGLQAVGSEASTDYPHKPGGGGSTLGSQDPLEALECLSNDVVIIEPNSGVVNCANSNHHSNNTAELVNNGGDNNLTKSKRRSSSTNSNPTGPPSSTEGSKGSSKSTDSNSSSFAHMNGVANGHIPVNMPQHTKC